MRVYTETKRGLDLIDKLVYVCLFCLGSYWVYKGDAVTKYILGRTAFSEFSEPISQLPTISACVEMNDSYKYGDIFNISFNKGGAGNNKLKLGVNTLPGNQLKVDLKEMGSLFPRQAHRFQDPNQQCFKITPLNFAQEMPLKPYVLKLTFTNSIETIKVVTTLTTENNSRPTKKLHDGEKYRITGVGGQRIKVNIFPQKFTFIEPCRNQPYDELLIHGTLEKLFQECTRPCFPQVQRHRYKDINQAIRDLPICRRREEKQCFRRAEKAAETNTLHKPCTILQYT